MTAISPSSDRSWAPPTRRSAAVFAAKAALLRVGRAARDLTRPTPGLRRSINTPDADVAAESRTPLWTDEAVAERVWQLGKVENLRRAARALDGLVIPSDAVFSFWRHVGPPVAARGFVAGRMLREGCMVPAIGGGLCQLSNALYDVALQAGCRIVERHPHSRVVPGSAAAEGRDATVAWNYVDLRFAADRELRLAVRLDADNLVVRLTGAPAAERAPSPATLPLTPGAAPRSCGLCEETECFRHQRAASALPVGRRTFLLDEAWPEFRGYVRLARAADDSVGFPIDGARWGLPRYAWSADGFAHGASAPAATVRRALAQRSAGTQGAARRAAELDGARRIAASLARSLTPETTELTVAQSYLPFLWRDGHLGGREVTVLMTRLPVAVLQARLDAVAATHPERATLADFRAPAWLAEAEAEALAAAVRVVTPHAENAAQFGERAQRLPWAAPAARAGGRPCPSRFIAFPGPTVARKGAHAVREAATTLGLEVMPLGAELEGPDFWRGVRVAPAGDWSRALAIVQPALVEDQPRCLLAALAAGVPVIATLACGLDPQPGLTLVPADETQALVAALQTLLSLELTTPPPPGSRSGFPVSAAPQPTL